LNGEIGKIPVQTRHEEEREFHRIRHTSMDKILESSDTKSPLRIVEPPRRTLMQFMNSSLVVAQEIALTIFLLTVHRVIVDEESTRSIGEKRDITRETLLVVDHLSKESSIAMSLVYATLLIIVYYNQQALKHQSTQTGHRRKKAMVRMTDAVLLASILRLTSGIIHTLTASYSSDTVYALSVVGMAIHLLTCDYKYANGVSSDADRDIASSFHTFAHPRPAFLGGTVSLNAVFFSTALLVSRIESNASSYAFVSLAVTLFAFYPATRHNIAMIYPNTLCEFKSTPEKKLHLRLSQLPRLTSFFFVILVGSPCFIITLTLSISVWFITTSLEKILFIGIQWVVLILSPCIQWDLQRYKRHISGAWDIAHISATLEMTKSKTRGTADVSLEYS
jgi:hypothetical protein